MGRSRVWVAGAGLGGLDVGFALFAFKTVDLILEALIFGAQGVDVGQSLFQQVSELLDHLSDLGIRDPVKLGLIEHAGRSPWEPSSGRVRRL
jgi:hypothetical protein